MLCNTNQLFIGGWVTPLQHDDEMEKEEGEVHEFCTLILS